VSASSKTRCAPTNDYTNTEPEQRRNTDIQDLFDVAQPNISQHLKALRREQIVDFYEDGNLRCYYITRPTLVKALAALLAREHKVVNRSAEEVRREGKRRQAETVLA